MIFNSASYLTSLLGSKQKYLKSYLKKSILADKQNSKRALSISAKGNSIVIEKIGQMLHNIHLNNTYSLVTLLTTFNIQKEFMPIFRYKYPKKNNISSVVYTGLVSEKNTKIKSEKFYFNGKDDNCFKKQIYKNPDVNKPLSEHAEIIEFRVHIIKDIIQVMDYPNYDLVYSIDKVQFYSNQNQKFGFDFEKDEKVEIVHFDILYNL